ncbi:MAG: sensor hybrid histidine kinase, partial [Rhodospirillales bacterium]|nr:sensor hybrid histidine kinase [Rhodospirillales bacterium]
MDIASYFTVGVDTSQALIASYEFPLVIASYLIATLAGFAFLRFTSRIIELGDSVIRFAWMTAGALTMGLGVWAMHFVGMLAYRLPIPVAYDPVVTAASALPAVLGSAVALHVVARPKVTTLRLLLGGVFMGAGIGAMHYTGMAAVRFDAFVRYDPVLFITSVVVAVALAFVALFATLWTMQQGGVGPTRRREAVGALIMGLAVSGMHYTAMTSAFCFSSDTRLNVMPFDPQVFAGVTTTVAVLVLLMAIGGVVFDRRLAREIGQRHRVQSQLQQAQKMEAIGQLTGGIAHDFNNLLGIIIGNLDLLKEMQQVDAKGSRLINAALDAALLGTDLNRRMLAFARRQSLQPERVDVEGLLTSMRTLVERAVGGRVFVRMSIGAQAETPIWPISVDLTQLEAAIINLAVNARDAMPDGGTLTIETANAVVDATYRASHPDIKPGDYVCISISDTGVGMTPEVQTRAFEPFFTTKSFDKGSGLGLSMVFGFVQQSGGYINIYSELGRGTVVRLYLPRADADAAPAIHRRRSDTVAVSEGGHETVLVVEDNKLMSEVATALLTELGYVVIIASNAEEALKIIDTDTSIDLLF